MEATRPAASGAVEAEPQPTAALDRLLNLPATELETRAAELLSALDTTPVAPEQRNSIAGALLDLLADPAFGCLPVGVRSLRRAMVESVLRIGYPWALHLEADDLALVRSEVGAVARSERWLALFIGTITAVATAAVVALWPSSTATAEAPLPTDGAALAESEAMASMVPKLRVRGDLASARAWAEGCALAARAPKPCLVQLRALAAEKAATTGDRRDVLRFEAIDAQVQHGDVESLRRDASSWLETSFLVAVAKAPPGQVLAGAFVDRAAEFATLEAAHRAEGLFMLARTCLNEPGQLGVLCRSVAGQFLVVPPRMRRRRTCPSSLPPSAPSSSR